MKHGSCPSDSNLRLSMFSCDEKTYINPLSPHMIPASLSVSISMNSRRSHNYSKREDTSEIERKEVQAATAHPIHSLASGVGRSLARQLRQLDPVHLFYSLSKPIRVALPLVDLLVGPLEGL